MNEQQFETYGAPPKKPWWKRLWEKTVFPDIMQRKREQRAFKEQMMQEVREEAKEQIKDEMKKKYIQKEVDKLAGKNKFVEGLKKVGTNIGKEFKESNIKIMTQFVFY